MGCVYVSGCGGWVSLDKSVLRPAITEVGDWDGVKASYAFLNKSSWTTTEANKKREAPHHASLARVSNGTAGHLKSRREMRPFPSVPQPSTVQPTEIILRQHREERLTETQRAANYIF